MYPYTINHLKEDYRYIKNEAGEEGYLSPAYHWIYKNLEQSFLYQSYNNEEQKEFYKRAYGAKDSQIPIIKKDGEEQKYYLEISLIQLYDKSSVRL